MSHNADSVASDEKVLTKSLAARLVEMPDGSDVSWEGWTLIDDDAAEVLSTIDGDFYLDDLRCLSPQAATSLSRADGELSLNGLSDLSPEVAQSLVRHGGGHLGLLGIQRISDEVAEILSLYDGCVSLGMAHMSPVAAETLLNGKALVEMQMMPDQCGTLELAFRQKTICHRPSFPWFLGAPDEDGDFLVVLEEKGRDGWPLYVVEDVTLWIDDRKCWLRQTMGRGEHGIEAESKPMDDIVFHFPLPKCSSVATLLANQYVERSVAARKLKRLGGNLPISASCAQLLPKAGKLQVLSVRLKLVATVLKDIVNMPSLRKLELLTAGLSTMQCKLLRDFKGELSVRGVDSDEPFTGLSEEGAATLAEKQGPLSVDLEDLPESVAAVLRNRPAGAGDSTTKS